MDILLEGDIAQPSSIKQEYSCVTMIVTMISVVVV